MLWWETPRETVERWEFKAQRVYEECNRPSLLEGRWTIMVCDCGKNAREHRICEFCWSYPQHPIEMQPTLYSSLQHALRHVV